MARPPAAPPAPEPSPAPSPAREPAASEPTPEEAISRLRVAGAFVVSEDGSTVSLRGVSIQGLDTVAPGPGQSLGDALCLDDANLTVLNDLWGVNLIRLPFQAVTFAAGVGGVTPEQILAGLDDLVEILAEAGIHLMLAMQAPPGPEGTSALAPDQLSAACWIRLARHFASVPTVVFEVYGCGFPIGDDGLAGIQTLVGLIRSQHPAALLFVGDGTGGDSVNGLPLVFSNGETVPNICYTIRAVAGRAPSPTEEAALSYLANGFPMVATEWTGTEEPSLDRSAEVTASVFERFGLGWSAAWWNGPPRLVGDAATHDFRPTRWGATVQRAMVMPVKESLTRLLPDR
jgi:hypothetical protein